MAEDGWRGGLIASGWRAWPRRAGCATPVSRPCLTEAMGYSAAGIRPPREKRDLKLPEELVEALDADPELAECRRW